MDLIKNKKILIVEDDYDIRYMLEQFIRKEGFYKIYTVATYREALTCFKSYLPQLVILDVMLPDGSGFDLITEFRKINNVPVLFLSAKGEDNDRILGLGLGADDYIVKPFIPKELILRISAILKRVYLKEHKVILPVFKLENTTINLNTAEIIKQKNTELLTAKEHAILLKLYANKSCIVTSDSLCQAVWGEDYYSYENTLMVHIRRIRKKIEENPSNPHYLVTVRGLGYKLIINED